MPKLKLLYLNKNTISTLELETFSQLRSLEVLSLGANDIATLPDRIFANLAELKELYLNNNKLIDISTNLFSQLYALKQLSLWKNLLTSLNPFSFRNNRKLQVLQIAFNYLSRIDEYDFVNLTSLLHLSMGYNRISSIHKNAFSDLKSLKQLYLDNNLIGNFEAGTFGSTKELEELSMTYNKLTELTGGLFAPLTKLKVLNLAHNEISHLDEVFPVTSTLRSVYLHGNNLKYLEGKVLQNFRGMTNLSLYENPWKCDCHQKDLYSLWQKFQNYLPPECFDPPKLQNKTWDLLELKDFVCEATIRIYPEESKIELKTGENFTLSCKGRDISSSMKLNWVYGNDTNVSLHLTEIKRSHREYSAKDKDGCYWYNLTILHLKPEDENSYTCKLIDGEKTISSETQNLVVSTRKLSVSAELTSNPSLRIESGENVVISCQVSLQQQNFNLSWLYENTPVNNSLKSSSDQFYQITNLWEGSSFISVLKIRSATNEDSGRYMCRLNDLDHQEIQTFSLVVSDKCDRKVWVVLFFLSFILLCIVILGYVLRQYASNWITSTFRNVSMARTKEEPKTQSAEYDTNMRHSVDNSLYYSELEIRSDKCT